MQTTITTLNENIQKEARTTLKYIVLFVIYYFFLILAGIALFGLATWITMSFVEIASLFSFISNEVVRIIAFILFEIAIFAMWPICILIAWHIVKPLLQIHRTQKEGYLEVKPEDAPELFALINEVAKETHNKMPKHVYLTANEVNAGVFYNSTSIWSIFFPTRKNLEIGVALLYGLSRAELKSILSHEFGHFAQGTMRVGTIADRLNLLIRDIISHAQEGRHNVKAIITEDTSPLAIIMTWFYNAKRFIARKVITLTTNSLTSLYRKIELNSRSLSRYLEFEADAVACQNVGSKEFVSALIKIHTTKNPYAHYQNIVSTLLREEKAVKDFWLGYQTALEIISKDTGILFDYKTILTEPVGEATIHPSKIKILNGWNTHPALEDRLAFARELACERVSAEIVDAASIVPLEKQNAVSKLYQQTLLKLMELDLHWSQLDVLDNEQAKTFITEELTRIPQYVYPFTQSDLQTFDYESLSSQDVVESPFIQTNRELILEYQQAIADNNTLRELIDNNEKFDIMYDGKISTNIQSTYQIHLQYLTQLQERIKELDKQIYLYLVQSTRDKEKIDSIYWETFYAQNMRSQLSKLLESVQEFEYIQYVQEDETDQQYRMEQQLINDFMSVLKTLPFDKLLFICEGWTIGTLSVEKILQKWEKWAQKSPSQHPKIVEEITVLNDILNHISQDGGNKLTAQIVETYSKK